jgi:fluoride exporter
MWDKILIVGLGGFIGANARYLIGMWASERWGSSFPAGTLLINLSGSFILGFFMPLTLSLGWSERWRLLVAVGFLGAFTTFSTFTYETMQLMARNEYAAATLYTFGSVVLGLVAVVAGLWLARMVLPGRV